MSLLRSALARHSIILLTSFGLWRHESHADEHPTEAAQIALQQVHTPDQLIAQSSLDIAARTERSIVGALEFHYNGQRITFISERATPSVVRLHVGLGEIVLEAEADIDANVRTLNGLGHALSLNEKLALLALSIQLERQLDTREKILPLHEDFLLRVSSYWSEAPVGWPLASRSIAGPPPGQPLAVAEEIAEDAPAQAAAACASGGENFLECQSGCVHDDDGITLLSNPCCCRNRSLWHDAQNIIGQCTIHGFCRESIRGGCDLPGDCLGRCGPECGAANGKGTYTLDCAEHDRCCRIHGACLNPDAIQCGDEFDDAADDFLFGATSCDNGCQECCANSDCDDGNICTTDTCTGGTCVHTNNPTANCDDGLFCNGTESCIGGTCMHSGMPCPKGSTCNETLDRCDAVAPQLIRAASRRTHGAAGTFDIEVVLGVGTKPAFEPRQNGTAAQFVLEFNTPVEATDGAINCGQEVVVTNGTCQSIVLTGERLAVNCTSNKNACVVLSLSGLRGENQGLPMTGESQLRVLTREGDVDASGTVNILDLQAIKLRLNQILAADNFKYDVTCNGQINILDLQAVKVNLNQAAACP